MPYIRLMTLLLTGAFSPLLMDNAPAAVIANYRQALPRHDNAREGDDKRL